MKTPKKLYGMDGEYDEPTKPMVYRNDAQKYDLYPNPARNTLIRKSGNSIDRLLKTRPMTESDRLDLIGKSKPKDTGTSLKVKSGSPLSKALNKFK